MAIKRALISVSDKTGVVEFAKDVNVPVPFCTAVAEFLQDVEDGKHSIIIDNLNNEVFKKLEI